MPPRFGFDRDQAVREIAAVEQALFEGYPPEEVLSRALRKRTATAIAAERLGVSRQTFREHVGSPTTTGTIYRLFKLKVDWNKFAQASPVEPSESSGSTATADPVEIRRLKDDLDKLKNLNRELERRVSRAENLRSDVMGLRDLPPSPISFPERDTTVGARETVVLMLSDLHWGEVVSLEAMDGLNSYSVEIARKRLGRWAAIVVDLLTKHWHGSMPPERIILILGGDLISGGIHLELMKTDEMRPLPAVRDVSDHLRAAILFIKDNVDCPIDIISLPGNHGRSSLKPESKEAALTSYDVLVSDFLEMGLKDREGINFFAPPSPDALFSVYGWRILGSHGDRIGARGGQGFIGPAATAARGLKRIVADYAARGIHIDLIVIGHLHTRLLLEEGAVNGSLIGPSEFSRDGRFRPAPAQQLLFCVHPRHLLTQMRWVEVGDPSEGSLYEPPPPDRLLRPRFRVKVVSEKV